MAVIAFPRPCFVQSQDYARVPAAEEVAVRWCPFANAMIIPALPD
jgi:hypothetical protein